MKHHKAKIDFSLVEKARDMYEYEKIQIKVISHKLNVPYWTLVDWLYYRTRVYK